MLDLLDAVLSPPPSVNNLYATVTTRRGTSVRIPTRQYKAWRQENGYTVRWPDRLPDDNRVRWVLHLLVYNKPVARDLDNYAKPAVDLICSMTGLKDRHLHGLTVYPREDSGGHRVWAGVMLMEDGDAHRGAGEGRGR